MGKKHKNRKEYPGKQQNEWENNNIEEPSNEDTSFTAKEVFANSQVEATQKRKAIRKQKKSLLKLRKKYLRIHM